ncbi:NAD(P)-binding domain-containing protein [Neobacillus sp. LXY-4]|uniref:NAD(P)-binding domain-containing protein n=1 Tax=Neobacillus sp. LXY-4 TaxID=3379826 RepID=UPI003EDECD41
MLQLKVGLVGIGKLGTAMMKHWIKTNIKIGIYHPNVEKAQCFAEKFPNSYCLTESALRQLDVLILALPAVSVIPFVSSIYEPNSPSHPLLINMATALDTKKIKGKFPALTVFGVKYMGHSKDLMEQGNGLFITEAPLPKDIEELYRELGEIKIDTEQALSEVNKLATYLAIKAAIDIEREFAKRGFPPEYVKRALTSLAPEVIRGYCEGNLGHFAQEIVKEIKGED